MSTKTLIRCRSNDPFPFTACPLSANATSQSSVDGPAEAAPGPVAPIEESHQLAWPQHDPGVPSVHPSATAQLQHARPTARSEDASRPRPLNLGFVHPTMLRKCGPNPRDCVKQAFRVPCAATEPSYRKVTIARLATPAGKDMAPARSLYAPQTASVGIAHPPVPSMALVLEEPAVGWSGNLCQRLKMAHA